MNGKGSSIQSQTSQKNLVTRTELKTGHRIEKALKTGHRKKFEKAMKTGHRKEIEKAMKTGHRKEIEMGTELGAFEKVPHPSSTWN